MNNKNSAFIFYFIVKLSELHNNYYMYYRKNTLHYRLQVQLMPFTTKDYYCYYYYY